MWHWKNKVLKEENIPQGSTGFIYCITSLVPEHDSKFYIGKKQLNSSRRTRISKKEKTSTKTRKTFKVVVKQSNYLEYYGSSQELLKDIELHGKDKFHREILFFCKSKKHLSYMEVAEQIKRDVLVVNSYNGNVMSRWFRKDLINIKED